MARRALAVKKKKKEQNEGCPEQGNESVDQNRKDLLGAEVKIY